MSATAHTDELIALVLSGEASIEQTQELNTWVQQSAENKKYFEQFSTIFNHSLNLTDQHKFDVDAAWEKVKLTNSTQQVEPKVKVFNMPWLSIAAGILAIVGFAFLANNYFNQNQFESTKTIALKSNNKVINQTLVDGSEVTLNNNSALFYTSDFNVTNRKINLSGEAFFKVKHNEQKPFNVWVNDLQILDIGTEFNIQALPQSDSVVVDVFEGTVSLNIKGAAPLELQAGEQGVYYKKSKLLRKQNRLDKNGIAWKNKIFIFENTDLHTVIALLNDVYGTHIILANKGTEKCKLNAQFNNENIAEIIDIVAATFNLKITKTDNSIVLDGKSCEE